MTSYTAGFQQIARVVFFTRPSIGTEGWRMARSLTGAMITELKAEHVRPIVLVEIEFASGWVRIWSGLGDLSWNGKTWNGIGDLGGIGSITESRSPKAQGLGLTLSGIPQSMVNIVLSETRQGKPGIVWLGFLDDAGQVIADPKQAFDGRVDFTALEEGRDSVTARVQLENYFVDANRTRDFTYTPNIQKERFPGDRGFDGVAAIQGKVIRWGFGESIPTGPGPAWIPVPGEPGTSYLVGQGVPFGDPYSGEEFDEEEFLRRN